MRTKEQREARKALLTPSYLDAERRKQALARIMREPTVDILTARCALGIGEEVAYREAANLGGQRIGKRWIFPTSKLRDLLGLSAQAAA